MAIGGVRELCHAASQDPSDGRTPMSADRAIELQDLSWTWQAEGRLDEAFRACAEALQLMEESDGPSSPDVANLLTDLAEIEHERGNLSAALLLAERAVAIEDALNEVFTGETARRMRSRTLALLGTIRRSQGDYRSGARGPTRAPRTLPIRGDRNRRPKDDRTWSRRDVPRPLPWAERAQTGEKRKFLALQLEQDPDLLMKGQVGLLAMPLPLSREQQGHTVWDRVSHRQESPRVGSA